MKKDANMWNNVFNIEQDKSQNINKLKIKQKILELFENSNYDYGMSIIIIDNEINLRNKLELIKLYIECERDKCAYKIVISSNLSSNQKKELIKVYRDLKYDNGKLGIDLEEKLITIMQCVNHDKESYVFKILTHNKMNTKKKIRLKKQYEKCMQDSSKDLVYCN